MNALSVHREASAAPAALRVDSGALETLKWLGVAAMTADHVGKYLYRGQLPYAFEIGRLALPLFAFVLMHNLAQPGALRHGVHARVLRRLIPTALVASVPYIGLGEAVGAVAWGWWPLNILFTLALATGLVTLLERGGLVNTAAAGLLFVAGGAFVEFCWPALALCMGAWSYCRRPGRARLALWIAATATLWIVNRNHWALAALPLIAAVAASPAALPRLRHALYAYYPVHLAVLWIAVASSR